MANNLKKKTKNLIYVTIKMCWKNNSGQNKLHDVKIHLVKFIKKMPIDDNKMEMWKKRKMSIKNNR